MQDFGASLTPLKDPTSKALQEQLDAALKEIASLKMQSVSPASSTTATPPPNTRTSKTPPSSAKGSGTPSPGGPGGPGGSTDFWLNSSISCIICCFDPKSKCVYSPG